MLLHKVRWCRPWLDLLLSILNFTQTPASYRWCTDTKSFRPLGGLGSRELQLAEVYCGQFHVLHPINFYKFLATRRSNSPMPLAAPRVLRGILHSKDSGPKSAAAALFLVLLGRSGFGRGRGSYTYYHF